MRFNLKNRPFLEGKSENVYQLAEQFIAYSGLVDEWFEGFERELKKLLSKFEKKKKEALRSGNTSDYWIYDALIDLIKEILGVEAVWEESR